MNANKVLSVQNDGFGDQTAAVLNDKKDTSGQRFEVRSAGNGYYTITAEHSGKVLDVNGASNASGATVQQYTSNGTNAQLWYFTNAGNGYYTIHSVLGTCLDVWSANTANGTMIDCYAYNGTNAQKWKLTKAESKPLENGTYSVTNVATNKVLSVNGSSTADYANVYVTGNQNLSSQRFELTYVSNGYYKILAEHSGKSLDIPAGNSASGVNLQQYSWNGSNAQLWKLVKLSDGSYYLRSKVGTVVGVQGSSTNVNMQSTNQSNAQKWKVSKTEYKPFDNGEYTVRSAANTGLTVTENNGNIQLGSYAGSSKQKFKLTYVSDGYYKIIESATGKALDICNGSSSNGANLQTYSWNGTNAQLWKFINMGNGSYYIRSKLGTVIDVTNGSIQTGTNIQMYTLNYSSAQKWTLKSTAVKAESIAEGTYTIQAAVNTNYVLDIAGGSTADGGNVQIYSKNNTLAQNFVVTSVGNGYYKIVCEGTGKVLDVSGGSSANGTNVQQYKWNGSAAQCWRFIDAGNGSYYIQSKLGTVLDIVSGAIYAGNNVQTYMLNETNAQKWKLSKLNYADIAEGTYTIQTALSTNKVLDVLNGSYDNGANIQIYDKNGTSAQNFVIKKLSSHEYQITCEKSGKALDVAGASISVGTNVWQYSKNNSNAQKWRFIDAGNGYYYIVSNLGTVLDINCARTANGTNVQTYTLNKSNAQKWKLVSNSKNSDLYSIMGTTSITATQMVNYFTAKGGKYPYSGNSVAPTIKDFCQIYVDECKAEGVKAEVAFAQAMMETGFLRFGGDVKKEQYNFAGLGATGGVEGNGFDSIRIGIRAQVQHLKAYASKKSLKQTCVDERFKYVSRGTAPYVEWLGQKENPSGKGWATAVNYGYNIVNLYIKPLLNTSK